MEMYGYTLIREEDLIHYGLKGMRWGTRRWQNYDATNTFNAAGIERYFGRSPGQNSQARKEPRIYHRPSKAAKEPKRMTSQASESINKTIKKQQKIEKRNENKLVKKITSEKIKEIVSSEEFKAAMKLAVVAVGTYAAYKIGKKYVPKLFFKYGHQRGNWLGDGLYRDGMDRLENLPQNFKSLSDIPRNFPLPAEKYFSGNSDDITRQLVTAEGLISGVNEGGFGSFFRSNNCTFCSSSVIMRLKGYNVNAAETVDGFYNSNYAEFFKGAKFVPCKTATPDGLVKTFKNAAGDGHYGAVTVAWKGGGAHSMAFSIRNGRLEILDGQVEQAYIEGTDAFNQLMNRIKIDFTTFADLTDCPPTDTILKIVKSA